MFERETEDTAPCACCGGQFRAHDRAVCSSCGQGFHLAMRTDVSVAECGQVGINEALEALEFGCNRCLEAAGLLPDGAPPRELAGPPRPPRRRYARVDRPKPVSHRRRPRRFGAPEDRDAI